MAWERARVRESGWMSTAEVAVRIGKTVAYVNQLLVERGVLDYVTVGHRRYVTPEGFRKYLAGGSRQKEARHDRSPALESVHSESGTTLSA